MSISRLISKSCIALFGVVSAAAAQGVQPAAPQDEDRTGLPASYQGPVSEVAAVVGEEVITTYDLTQRVMLMMISAGQRFPESALPQLEAQALRDLVEEKLKLNEAAEYDLKPEKKEIDAELQAIAAQSGLTYDDMEQQLNSQGLTLDSLRSQIGAQMLWPQLVRGKFGRRVRVNEDELELTVERMREEAGSEQYLVSEICIPIPSREEAQTYYQGSMQLLEQMRRGVPFAVVAQQFSACTSAAAGGDMGWIRAGELPEELDQAVRELPVGAVTNPIPVDNAFMILAVREKRAPVQQGAKTWTLAYASAPLDKGRNEARNALEKLQTSNACAGGGSRQDLGPLVTPALLPSVQLKDIDPRFHTAIEDLDRGDMSAFIEADGRLHVAYVCELDEGLGIPSRRTLEDRLYQRQLNKFSDQYLRDVERRTMVDIRLKRQGPANPNG
jgi:peptidyl-prolyl cis-trans isomerase SurA